MATEEYSIGYEDGKSAGFDECMAQQRTWVGLTDEEVMRVNTVREAEALLKEKNT